MNRPDSDSVGSHALGVAGSFDSPAKLTKAESGLRGARKRWSNPANRRSVRLDDLTPSQRRLVLALIDAAKSETHSAADKAAA